MVGPWNVEFFLDSFDVMGNDLLNVVEKQRLKGKVVGALHVTCIALTPKGDKPRSLNDYRPISLCNLVYKIISKIIANRIKPMMSKWMSKEEFGFLV